MSEKIEEQKQITPLAEFKKILQIVNKVVALGEDGEGLNYLETVVMLKRAETVLSHIKSKLRTKANADFKILQGTQPDKQRWSVASGLGMVAKHTPRCTWKYPEELAKEALTLNGKLKEAQENKSAQRIVPPTDETTMSLFSITLTESLGK